MYENPAGWRLSCRDELDEGLRRPDRGPEVQESSASRGGVTMAFREAGKEWRRTCDTRMEYI